MPNGRSGGFGISKEDFERVLSALPANAVVGRSMASGVVIDVSTAGRMVSDYPDDLIAVEEQHYSGYIIHLEPIEVDPPNGEKWIIVWPESPLFEDLKRQHARQRR
jgi:hypothetical protein